VKSSKAQIMGKFHKVPTLRFENQQLTSFSGRLIFQLLFQRLELKNRLRKCFAHVKVSPILGRHLIIFGANLSARHGTAAAGIEIFKRSAGRQTSFD
jgi:hypothetical protein